MTEKWRDIPGYEKRYQVSDAGRVRSLDRPVRTMSKTGTVTARISRGKILAPQEHSQGYAQVTVQGKLYLVHVLVLLAFVGPVPLGMECAHEDGVKTNNRLKNLRYDTRKGNAADRIKHGTSGRGSANTMAKLNNVEVREILTLFGVIPTADIASAYGIHPHSVARLNRRERWGHL